MGCGSSKTQAASHNDSMTSKQTHASKYVATQQQQVSTTVNTTILVKNENEAPLSIDTLRQYNKITAVVAQYERKNVVQRLEEKMQNSIDLKNQASQMNEEYKQLQNKTHKELKDVQNLEELASADNMMNYFKDQVSFDNQMSKEQEEYIQAKTEMEDCKKRINALQSQQSKLKMEIEELKKDRDEMTKHYDEQDEILESIFKGSYGSDLENQLEGELDKEQDKKQRKEVDYQRWKNAEIMAGRASEQLSCAYDKWQTIPRIPAKTPGNKLLRLNIADQVRKFLVAASQNLTAINRTLHTVNKLPYCDMSEVETLDKLKNNIFNDMKERSRHSKAGNVYKTTRERCLYLVKWITHVITGIIQKELDQSRKKCKDLHARLREERSSLMKKIIEEKTGEKVNLEEASTDSGIDTDVESETSEVAAEAEMIPEAQDLDQQIKDAQEDEVDKGEVEKVQTPATVPPDELAPAPKQEEIFGNSILLMAESDEQLDEHIKEIEANCERAVSASHARAHAELQLKLKSRRSRRRRMMAQEQALNELMKKEEEAAMIEVPNK